MTPARLPCRRFDQCRMGCRSSKLPRAGLFCPVEDTPYKRLIELSEGTHTVMMEKNRMQFFRELMGFLDEEKPLALK